MCRKISYSVLALVAGLAACDSPVPTSGSDEPRPGSGSPPVAAAAERSAMDRLARRLARALADPGFRTYVKDELQRSPFVEHKLQLQGFLGRSGRRAIREMARLTSASEAEVESEARLAIPLEIYFPVDAHRAAWQGGPEVLVASARQDGDAPVAYDIRGRRRVLSPDTAPAEPVLAVVPVETDFSQPRDPASPMECTTNCGGGGGGGGGGSPPLPAGLWMSYSHFVQDFEGWFKGDPEFEIHILGQAGTSDSLADYQCAGANAGGYYRFDQNDLDWRGKVLLFSQTQLTAYKAAHPNQNFRIIALEDDDTACVIKFDPTRFKNMINTVQVQYPNLTGAKDTVSGVVKWVKRANALQKILSAAYSFITTQDDLIGNAVEDVVVGQYYNGANWVIKGEKNATNGWIKLEMR